jgi:hypothetical protein
MLASTTESASNYTTNFLYDGGPLVGEYDSTGNMLRRGACPVNYGDSLLNPLTPFSGMVPVCRQRQKSVQHAGQHHRECQQLHDELPV